MQNCITVYEMNPYKCYDYPSGGHVDQYTPPVSHWSHSTSSRQTGRGNGGREREQGEDKQQENHVQMGSTAVKMIKQDATEMQSQYQRDFPPPSSCRRRRTPALPQPDNIGINPAFGWEWVCQCHINVETSSWMSAFCFSGLSSTQSKERLTLVGRSQTPERPHPENQAWLLSGSS